MIIIVKACRREIELVELIVDACVLGDRELALQALCLDPMVDDIDVARAVLDDYLDVHRQHLPQFSGSGRRHATPAPTDALPVRAEWGKQHIWLAAHGLRRPLRTF